MARPLRGILLGRRVPVAVPFLLALAVLAAIVSPVAALAAAPAPHVSDRSDSDVCAMCHRTHSSAAETKYRSLNATDITGDALIVGSPSSAGDTGLCYACHGVDSIGSESDVQSAFLQTSAHVLAAQPSTFGPSPKQCSDCHDSHGSDKTVSGTPYPALLRSRSGSGVRVFSAEEYCATCHASRPGERFESVAVYRRTAHFAAMPDPASGTKIRCSNCHAPHGSSTKPLIADTLYPPAIDATTTVIANDRSFCMSCHVAAYATWRGPARWAASTHATSSAQVTITAAFASGATRLAGECQNCHAPMGRSDGRGGAIAKLGEKEGPALCLTCHDVRGPGRDMSEPARALAPTTGPELVAVWAPPSPTAADGRISVYARDVTGTAPFALTGPREYRMTGAGTVGAAAAGDIDGDDGAELVVADPAFAGLTVFRHDELRGLAAGSAIAIAQPADLVAVADVLPGDGRDEIVVVNKAGHTLRIYQYSAGMFTLMDGPFETGLAPSGIAAGDVTGTAGADIVVTSADDGTFRVFSEVAAHVVASGAHAAGQGATGPSTGDVRAGGKAEIVVCASEDGTGSVGVFDGGGNELTRRAVDDGATGVLSASVVADVLPGRSAGGETMEVVVALADTSGMSVVAAFPADGSGGLAAPVTVDTGTRYATGSLAAGDVDGDAGIDLVAGNAGVWSPVVGSARVPSVQVLHATEAGTTFDAGATETLWGGGTEVAGNAPSLVLADLGAVGTSRHPSGVVPGAHVSTETAPFTRHVECTDCHDVHESTDATAVAPLVNGPMLGAWGVQVTNVAPGSVSYVGPQPAQYEYEVCFKCHSGWAGVDLDEDVGMEFNVLNQSTHAVEASSTRSSATGESFANGWSNDSILRCTDCHGSSNAAGPSGLHASDDAPLLVAPYRNTDPGDPDLLCYRCHRRDVYFTGAADAGASRSWFGAALHRAHSYSLGFGCASCHESHGSRNERRLMRGDVGFSYSDTSVTCANECHASSGGSKTYSRP